LLWYVLIKLVKINKWANTLMLNDFSLKVGSMVNINGEGKLVSGENFDSFN